MQTVVQDVPVTIPYRRCFKKLAIHSHDLAETELEKKKKKIRYLTLRVHQSRNMTGLTFKMWVMWQLHKIHLTAMSVDLHVCKKSELCLHEQVVFSMWNSSKAIIHKTKKMYFHRWQILYQVLLQNR